MKPIIRVSGLGKQYRIGRREAPYSTLRESLTRAARAPFDRIRRVFDRRREGNGSTGEDLFWALKDIDFEVHPGEVVGVIGRNGAGKSTLLKILSRVTEPTSGRIDLFGRIGSLLEVGTGFHPELTGRENIYLNGAILGMSRREIDRKFDEIIAFSEIEQFLDTPVKRYSSGMYVRLAFAVAAHLEPEILVVDEVLAVGDVVFQRKCLGKMGEVARTGRTILFVSHNMSAINQLCTRAILLTRGRVSTVGKTADVVSRYLRVGAELGGEQVWDDPQKAPGNDRARLRAVRVLSEGTVAAEPGIDRETTIEVEFWNFVPGATTICANIYLYDSYGNVVFSTANTAAANAIPDEWFGRPHPVGLYRAACTIPANFLNNIEYWVTVYLISLGPLEVHAEAQQVLSFRVTDVGTMRESGAGSMWHGVVRPRLPWQTELVEATGPEGARPLA